MRFLGAIIRGALVLILLSLPAFLTPGVDAAAREISVIIASIAAFFAMVEYAARHPSLVEFRFAPPYNRMRFLGFCGVLLALVFLARAAIGLDGFSGTVLALSDWAVATLSAPLSPVTLASDFFAKAASPERSILGLRAAASSLALSGTIAAVLITLFWLFRWPISRDNFNVWDNLPTFQPPRGKAVETALLTAGFANAGLGILVLYLVPFVASRGGWIDPAVLNDNLTLIWGCALWAFFPMLLVVRGAAMLKLSWQMGGLARR